ncbi:MAG: VWA domain-containing protein, partial [Planctomycetota bacterium]|nr:VWA domain-containing protein [Planctomycetota bacterium]
MNWLLGKLFGIGAQLDPGSRLHPVLIGLWGWAWALIPLLALAAWFVWWAYRRDARKLSPERRRLLCALRVLTVLTVILMILKPAFSIVKGEDLLPLTAVLVDDSRSMELPDSPDNPLVKGAVGREERSRMAAARKAVLTVGEDLVRTHRIKVYTFSDVLKPVRDLAWRGREEWEADRQALAAVLANPAGEHTDVGDAVIRTINDFSGRQQLSGIVLVSDGRRTGGAGYDEAAALAKENGIPVFTVATGSALPLRDLRIASLTAPPEANLNDILAMRLVVVNHIQPNLPVEIKLFEKNAANKQDELKETVSVTLPEGSRDLIITTIPKVEGEVKFTVRLPHFPDELTYDNNTAEVFVNVVKRSLKVLYIAGAPTQEYHFQVTCLSRDPIINVSCWLDCADVDYPQQGKTRIERLPKTLEEWMMYDVVVLYDIDPEKFGNEQENGLEHLIRKGGGLLAIAGRTHGLDSLLQVRTEKMKELLPVVIDKTRHPNYREVFDKPFKAVRTEAGVKHPVFIFDMSAKANEKVWESFPQFYWHHPVVRARPESVVLLKKEGPPDDRGDVLMALMRYGEGVVFYSGLDTLWRWRYPMENYDYDRFWTQIIRYLGETRLLGTQKQVILETDKKTYSPGETVKISLAVLDPALDKQLRREELYA